MAASFAAYMATDRKDAALWVRFGLYGGALAVALSSLWTGIVRPLQGAPSLGAVMAWLGALDGARLVMLVPPPPAAALLCVLWFEVAVAGLKHLHGAARRRRAESATSTAMRSFSVAASCEGWPNAAASCWASGAHARARR